MIEVQKFEMVSKGALVCRFNLKMHKWGGLVIRECSLFESGDKRWINLPSRQYEIEGKKKYASYLVFEDRNLDDAFKNAIIKAVDEYRSKLVVSTESVSEEEESLPF